MSCFNGARVLITGGTGSFGKKCAKMLLDAHDIERMVIFSRDEQKHVDMSRTALPPAKYPQVRYFVGDVRDLMRLRRALQGIDIVIHAAAMKHVDVAEYNPQECIRTNIGGAENLIHACLDTDVKKVLALSTDKAANPINLYGATKLCSDKLFLAANSLAGSSDLRFSVVRYGNVFGSNGSVVPFFVKQRENKVLPVTDTRMTRFIITLEQGVDFVMKSLERMSGGEVFVPKIPSTNIMDIAKAVAPECEIKIVGIRPGEKIHEIMVPVEEARQTIEMDDHFVITSATRTWSQETAPYYEGHPRCADGFSYSSDTNTHWLTQFELHQLVQPFVKRAAA